MSLTGQSRRLHPWQLLRTQDTTQVQAVAVPSSLVLTGDHVMGQETHVGVQNKAHSIKQLAKTLPSVYFLKYH